MNFEKVLIAACLKDEVVLKKAQRARLQPHHLEEKIHRYLYKVATEVNKFDVLNKDVISEYVRLDVSLDDKVKTMYMHAVEDYYSMDVKAADFTLSNISRKVKEKEITRLLSESADKILADGDIDKIIEDLHFFSSSLKNASTDYEIFDYWKDWTKRQAERLEVEQEANRSLRMELNMTPFKKYFPRGWQSKEITAIGGITGVGKSVLLSNLIRLAIHPANKLNAIYIFAENKKIQAASRLDAIMLDRSYDSLFLEVTKDPRGNEFFLGTANEEYGSLKIVKVVPGEFDALTVKSIIEECREAGVNPDIVFIDSPDHAEPVAKVAAHWEKKAKVYWELKALADNEDVIMVTTLPMKPSSAKGENVSAEDGAGSYDIARICDNLIFFNVLKEDRLLSRASLKVTKSRDKGIDDAIIHFKFTNSLRLVPWEEVAEGVKKTDGSLVYKIKDFDSQDQEFKSKFVKTKV
jgi:hypothetical protein